MQNSELLYESNKFFYISAHHREQYLNPNYDITSCRAKKLNLISHTRKQSKKEVN